jgi:PKD repeat protein
MRIQASLSSALPALAALLLLPQAASAASQWTDTTVTVSSQPATRATVVSEPVPVDLGAGRVLFAPMGEGPGEQFGNSVASAGDVNGDGYADVIVGAWTSDAAAGGDAGSAYVYYGGPGADDVADLTLHGEYFSDNFGTSVASAGDVNGDGYGDLIVGAWRSIAGASLTGRAYVFYGGPAADPIPDLVLSGQAFGDRFGISVSSAGDLNADGFADVIVGASGNDAGGFDAGRAYIYFGGAAANVVADLVLTGAAGGDGLGYAVSSAGDLNADGFADIVVGAFGSGGTGRAYVYYGGPGLDTVADRIFTGEAAGDNFGLAVASAGDVNGDGNVDLIIAAVRNDAGGIDAGRAYLFYGGSGVDAVADMTFTGTAAGDNFGVSVSSAGDMNGDGIGDLIVGAWMHDTHGPNDGRAYIYYGGPGADGIADIVLTGEGADDRFGLSVAGAGDMNADGTADVIVGAYFNDFAGADAGRAYVVTGDASRPPVVTAPATVTGNVGVLISFSVTVLDPDGDAILSLTAAPLPAGAAFTSNGAKTSGTFNWTPGPLQVGGHAVTFTASNGLTGSATTSIEVNGANSPPVLTVPASVFGAEGVFISLQIAATDPDGDHVTLGALNRPVGSLFVDFGNNSGSFSWTPGFSQAGTYTVTFTGRDALGTDATPRNLTIVVDNVNRDPIAIPGGPYVGVVNVPITFNGTGSADPDGSPLSYLWDFGDLATAAGVTPVHSYVTGGTFTVTLTVGDGSLTDNASTISTIGDIFQARAFTTSSNRTIKLGSGKATWCTMIEPVSSSFLNTAVISSTITMKYGTGQIFAQAGKASIGGDKDANGVQETTVCFAKTELRALFAGLPNGSNSVTVTLEGDLSTGGKFRAALTVDVVGTGGALAAFLSPNPLNPVATLTITTSQTGRVKVSIFDLQGRLVRTLEPGAYLEAGYHDFQLDGRNEQGERLSSGVYFYRVEAVEGTETGRFVIAK